MKIEEVIVADAGTSLLNVWGEFAEKDCIVVTKENDVLGVITHKDIIKKKVKSLSVKCGEIATRVHPIRPPTSTVHVAKYMYDADEHYIPAIDNGKIGAISIFSLLEEAKDSLEIPAGDVASTEVITAYDDDDVGSVLFRMRTFNISIVPVIDSSTGRIAGSFSARDVVTKILFPAKKMTVGERVGEKKEIMRYPISEFMGSDYVTIDWDEKISDRIDELCSRRAFAMFVMKKGRIAGILTLKDLLELILPKGVVEGITINISTNIPNLDRAEIEEEIRRIYEKFKDVIGAPAVCYAYVKIKGGIDNKIYAARFRIYGKRMWMGKAESLSLTIAIREALERLELNILRDKEEMLDRVRGLL